MQEHLLQDEPQAQKQFVPCLKDMFIPWKTIDKHLEGFCASSTRGDILMWRHYAIFLTCWTVIPDIVTSLIDGGDARNTAVGNLLCTIHRKKKTYREHMLVVTNDVAPKERTVAHASFTLHCVVIFTAWLIDWSIAMNLYQQFDNRLSIVFHIQHCVSHFVFHH